MCHVVNVRLSLSLSLSFFEYCMHVYVSRPQSATASDSGGRLSRESDQPLSSLYEEAVNAVVTSLQVLTMLSWSRKLSLS